MNTNNLNNEIKDVIERNIDAYKCYLNAADNVKNTNLAQGFREEATQRKSFATQLETATNAMNKNVDELLGSGSFEGGAHRTWMDIRSALSTNKDEAVVEECLRGEKEALDEYNELLREENISGESHALIRGQRDEIKNSISKLEQLEAALD